MPTGSQAEKERKRYIVAVGVITGKSRAVIAQEAGCQARHVRRLAQELPTRLLISELLRPYQLGLARCMVLAVNAIVRALDDQKKTPEDHYAQLAAVDQLTRYLEMAQGQTPSRSVKRSAGRGAPAQRLPDVA